MDISRAELSKLLFEKQIKLQFQELNYALAVAEEEEEKVKRKAKKVEKKAKRAKIEKNVGAAKAA